MADHDDTIKTLRHLFEEPGPNEKDLASDQIINSILKTEDTPNVPQNEKCSIRIEEMKGKCWKGHLKVFRIGNDHFNIIVSSYGASIIAVHFDISPEP